MATVTLKGNEIHTSGELPSVGEKAPDFQMIRNDLSEVSLYSLEGKFKVLNIFPSIDTGTCAMSVRQFNQRASDVGNCLILNISKDLPFAQKRFCGAEGIDKAETLSVFRSDFAKQYGLELTDGPLKGLCARVVLVLDADNKVVYSELISEITEEPNYDAALSSLK